MQAAQSIGSPRSQAWNSLTPSGCPASVCPGVSADSGHASMAFTSCVVRCDSYTVQVLLQ